MAGPLPTGLPAPVEDGAARHLSGRALPPLERPATYGSTVRLDRLARGRWVLSVYPLTGEPGVDVHPRLGREPGARELSEEACGFRDNLRDLEDAGVEEVLALSSDRIRYQQERAARLHLPYRLLSDPELRAADALDMPGSRSSRAPGRRWAQRLSLVLDGPSIKHVFYPVPPDRHAPRCSTGISTTVSLALVTGSLMRTDGGVSLWREVLAFAGVSAVWAALPGPDTLLLFSRALGSGVRAAATVAIGLVLGKVALLTAAVLGVAAAAAVASLDLS